MIQVSNSEDELDKISGVRTYGLVVVLIANDSKEEEEIMLLERKNGLCKLLVSKAKGLAPNDDLGSQLPLALPPLPPSLVNPFAPAI